MVNHSSIAFLLFSLFFYSHFNGAFDDAEHAPIGIQDRAKRLAQTDQCVEKYLERVADDKKLAKLSYIIDKCALVEYFSPEEFGNRKNGSSFFSLFPLFQHSHLRKCNSCLFFGTSSYDMAAEKEILKNVDFDILDCRYLVLDKKRNIHGLKNHVQVAELTEIHLNDILLQYKSEHDYVIEHLFLTEMKGVEDYMDKLLKIRQIYSLTICQITIRLPHFIEDEKLLKLADDILKNDIYILLKFRRNDAYTEFYFFANNEYQCMMRYL